MIKMFQKQNKADKFFIGKGVFVTKDTCIPVNAISMIDVYVPPVTTYLSAIMLGVLGLLAILIKSEILKTIGVMLIILAVLMAGLVYFANTHRTYALHIQVHSGFMVTIESNSIDYIRELKDQFLECINDTSSVKFIDASRHIVKQDIGKIDMKYIYDQTITGNTIGKDLVVANGSSTVESVSIDGDNNVVQRSSEVKNGLSARQWEVLEKYFIEQSKVNSQHQDECVALSKYARSKDTKGLKTFMRALGSKVMTEIVGAGTREVLNIIKIILAS